MTEYLIPTLAALAGLAAAVWYGHRWGRDDGYAEGYDEGRQKGLLEGAALRGGLDQASGGGGGGPKEPA